MEIADFSRDLTAEAEAGLIEPPIGRDEELKQIFTVLNQESKANVLITGPAGCGKTALAEGIACQLVNNRGNSAWKRNKLITLDLTALNAGASYVGQFEERVNQFLDHIKSDPGIVVFIDEIHMLMGFGKTGNSGASRDLSQIIKPALARGEMACIGATTREEFQQHIAADGAFVRRFTELEIHPLAPEAVFRILQRIELKSRYSDGVAMTDRTLAALVRISEQKWPQRFQPDKAIDLFRSLAAKSVRDRRTLTVGPANQKIDEFVDFLTREIALIRARNHSALKKLASKWLGVDESEAQTLDLDDQAILAMLAAGK